MRHYGLRLDSFRESVWKLVNQTTDLDLDSKASILLEIEEQLNDQYQKEVEEEQMNDLEFTNLIREKEDRANLGRAIV
tara:strand:- start:310 stop:543 length:234 start_codon:yes stop_codon:yes gene_type:complete